MTDELRALNQRGWRLYDTARAAGLCGALADAHGAPPAGDPPGAGLRDVRSCHLSLGHRGPHAARWLGELIAWTAEQSDPAHGRLTATTVHGRPPASTDPEEETAGAFLRRMGTDATVWTAEFAKRFGGDPTPGSWLHGWVCNMIEAGRSAGYSEYRREQASRLQAVDACAQPQVTGEVSRPNAGVDARHVVPATPDTSPATAAAGSSYANASGLLRHASPLNVD
jgi:hypothetical protein